MKEKKKKQNMRFLEVSWPEHFVRPHLLIIQSFHPPKTFTKNPKMQINESKLEANLKSNVLKLGLRRTYF